MAQIYNMTATKHDFKVFGYLFVGGCWSQRSLSCNTGLCLITDICLKMWLLTGPPMWVTSNISIVVHDDDRFVQLISANKTIALAPKVTAWVITPPPPQLPPLAVRESITTSKERNLKTTPTSKKRREGALHIYQDCTNQDYYQPRNISILHMTIFFGTILHSNRSKTTHVERPQVSRIKYCSMFMFVLTLFKVQILTNLLTIFIDERNDRLLLA